MSKKLLAVSFIFSLTLGAGCGLGSEPELEFCPGSTRQLYDPDSWDLLAWPDDALAVSAETSTGLRLTGEVPWMEAMPPLIQEMLSSIAGPTGFARQGALLMRFNRDAGLEPGVHDAPTADDPLVLFSWSEGRPQLVPFSLEVDDEGKQIRVQPLRPLCAGTPHALILRSTHLAADGQCVAPSRVLREILSGAEPSSKLARVARQLSEAIEALGISPDVVSAALTFTTHDDLSLIGEIARDIHDDPPRWSTRPTCAPDGDRRVCEGTFLSRDYRSDGAVESVEVQGTWEVPITLWLPLAADGPVPLVMFGHGMSSSRSEGSSAARYLLPEGIAVAAVDALHHGEHPTSTGDPMVGPLNFLGIDLSGPTVNGRALRGNFVQTALDRLQATSLLQSDPDVDGDGVADLDPSRFGYWGVSMGAMIGSIQMALSDHLDAGILTLAGGHLIEFATTGQGSFLIQGLFLEVLEGDEAALKRVLLVAQTMADPGDPAVFGAHVRRDRLVGDTLPHVLMPVTIHDDVVPAPTGRAIARAFGLPHAEPVHEAVSLLPAAGPLPLKLNAGDHTAVFLQFDTVGNPPVKATHENTSQAPEVREMSRRFFVSWAETGEAEVPALP